MSGRPGCRQSAGRRQPPGVLALTASALRTRIASNSLAQPAPSTRRHASIAPRDRHGNIDSRTSAAISQDPELRAARSAAQAHADRTGTTPTVCTSRPSRHGRERLAAHRHHLDHDIRRTPHLRLTTRALQDYDVTITVGRSRRERRGDPLRRPRAPCRRLGQPRQLALNLSDLARAVLAWTVTGRAPSRCPANRGDRRRVIGDVRDRRFKINVN